MAKVSYVAAVRESSLLLRSGSRWVCGALRGLPASVWGLFASRWLTDVAGFRGTQYKMQRIGKQIFIDKSVLNMSYIRHEEKGSYFESSKERGYFPAHATALDSPRKN